MPRFCNVEITNMSESISHSGIVEKIENGVVYVRIVQQSACAGCHARAVCTASESKEKIIEVPDRSGAFHVNEDVLVCGGASLGMQAVLLAFVGPLLMILAAIMLGSCLHWEETTSGIFGLLLLIPYYGVLYGLRDRLKKRFVFTLRKLN